MLYLHNGGGASITEIRGPLVTPEEWSRTKASVSRLLAARRQKTAAALFDRIPFEWADATNYFSDEFSILQAVVPVDQYIALEEAKSDKTIEQPFKVALDSARTERAERSAREQNASVLGAQLATVREWPAVHLSGLEGATATLTTVCQGYSSYHLGTLRYQLTIKNAGAIERRVRSAYFPRADFHIQLLDRSGFKQSQIDLEWSDLTSVVSNSARSGTLQANDAAGPCGGELRQYSSWNLSYALPEPRPSF